MDNFKNILSEIQNLINSSNGNLINYGKSKFLFQKRKDVSLDEITNFEEKFKVNIPKPYKEFLLTIGSCTLFQDELLPGFDFLAPSEFYDWSQQVFEGTGCNLFPDILITVSIPRTGGASRISACTRKRQFWCIFS